MAEKHKPQIVQHPGVLASLVAEFHSERRAAANRPLSAEDQRHLANVEYSRATMSNPQASEEDREMARAYLKRHNLLSDEAVGGES
jgi:hypothetical protein